MVNYYSYKWIEESKSSLHWHKQHLRESLTCEQWKGFSAMKYCWHIQISFNHLTYTPMLATMQLGSTTLQMADLLPPTPVNTSLAQTQYTTIHTQRERSPCHCGNIKGSQKHPPWSTDDHSYWPEEPASQQLQLQLCNALVLATQRVQPCHQIYQRGAQCSCRHAQ